ncbi:MAG: hypothetical protein WB616_20035 [Candidatus Sulfotelmatobacter sp.]|jgi:hypothetical protein
MAKTTREITHRISLCYPSCPSYLTRFSHQEWRPLVDSRLADEKRVHYHFDA